MSGIASADLWSRLRRTTPARIGLGRVGHALPLNEVLQFQLAHAQARDAVHAALDGEALATELAPMPVLQVESAASDRAEYLRRPDRSDNRRPRSALLLSVSAGAACDVVFVIGDGLSATGVQAGAARLVRACVEELRDLTIGPVVIARQARVALGDPIGEALNARVCVMVIGERPGLSVSDSLGLYLTFGPRAGCSDAQRNCISNIHGAGGLSPHEAAATLGWLLRESLRRQLSGVDLKHDQTSSLVAPYPSEGTI